TRDRIGANDSVPWFEIVYAHFGWLVDQGAALLRRRRRAEDCAPCAKKGISCCNNEEGYAYSITSSARTSSDGGTVRPSAFAVLRLITSSNLTGAWTGRSLGFSPFSIRSTYDAARRYSSTR